MKRFIVCALFLSVWNASLFALIIGNNTAALTYPFITFPSGQNNQIIGFAGLFSGFALQDSATTCTFSGKIPIRGPISLNDGTLYLNADMVFDNVLTLTSLGNVIALAPYALELSSGFTDLGDADDETVHIFQDVQVTLHSDVKLHSTIQFNGICDVIGEGFLLELGSNSNIIVGPNSVLRMHNIGLVNVHDTNVRALDNTGVLILEGSQIVQDADWNFSAGAIIFRESVDFIGSSTFVYTSVQTSTIDSATNVFFSNGTTFNAGRVNVSTAIEPLHFIDSTSVLHFDNSRFIINPNGMTITNGIMELHRKVFIDLLSTLTDHGLSLGNGNPENNMKMQLVPGATAIFSAGELIYNVTAPNAIDSGSPTSRFIAPSGGLAVIQDMTFSELQITLEDISLFFAEGKKLRLEDIILKYPFATINVLLRVNDLGTFVLEGNGDYFNIMEGVSPFLTIVQGTNNTINGLGDNDGFIILTDDQTELTLGLQGDVANSIVMNGGSLILTQDLNLGNDASLLGLGTVYMQNNSVNFGDTDFIWTGSTFWNGTPGIFNLNSTLSLLGTWTISGMCTINGNNNTLDLKGIGQIVVAENSQLIFRNIELQGISGSNIRCVDDTGVITLNNIEWTQVDDYRYASGALIFNDIVNIRGSNVFAYQSAQTSTVSNETILSFDENTTFSYDPIFVASQDLIQFVNKSSQLVLNGATLYTTTTGMRLTKGSMIVADNSTIAAEIEEFNPGANIGGFIFGNDTSADDFRISIAVGTTLYCPFGVIAYRNVNSNSYRAGNMNSTLFMDSPTELDLWQTLDLGTGVAKFGDNAYLGIAPGKALIGTVIPLGSLNQFVL